MSLARWPSWALLAAGVVLIAAVGSTRAGPGSGAGPAETGGAIPVRIRLDRPGYVTLAIEDRRGDRVRNRIAETRLPAGESTISWDGYDDGRRDESGALVRRRVAPGSYRLRGLTHDGLALVYEMTVDNPGRPPWATRDGSGGWLADHSAPADILHLPGGVPSPNARGRAEFLVCSTSGEAGSEFVWLDGQGRRLHGNNDGFWGGTHLARDAGADPAPGYLAFVFQSGQRDADNFTIEVRGFRDGTGDLESVIKYPRPHSLRTFRGHEAYGSDGLAAYNGRLVFAVTMLDRLVVVDARGKRVIGEVTLPSPRAPAFDREGRLTVITGGRVKRFRIPTDAVRLEEEEVVVGQGLDDPRRLRLDERGNLYVSDWGGSHQVKVFDPRGRLLRVIGKSGGPQIGRYDEGRMAHPCGVAIDDRGRLWVAEGDIPRRLSLWEADGTFVRALYGPMKYGGGGALDPLDGSRFYYDDHGAGIEFALDREAGSSRVKSIFWRRELMPEAEPIPDNAPEHAFVVGGRRYLVNCYNGSLRHNQDRCTAIWRLDDDAIARPVAMIANAADLVHRVWGWPMKHRDAIVKLWEGHQPEQVLFVWSDEDGDSVAERAEIRWVAEDHSASPGHEIGGIGLEALIHPDLSFTTAYGTHVPPPRIDQRGVPHYDLAARRKVGDAQELRSPLIVGDRALLHRDADNSWLGFDLRGRRRLRYPAAPEEQLGGPGAMVAPTRLLGPPVTPTEGQAGPLVAINGEMGAIFLLTVDGLFLQTLGGDARRLPPLSESDPRRGWRIEGVTFQQEHFHPTIRQVGDGRISLTIGFQQGTLARLEGLGGVRRRDFGELILRDRDLEGIPETSVQPARKGGRPTQEIAIRPRGPEVDGDLADWPAETGWMRIDDRAEAAAIADAKTLYLAYRTDDPQLLDNAGRDPRYLFKTGGALDLMLGTDPQAARDRGGPAAGDLRLIVTRIEGRPAAVLYRAVAPGAPQAGRTTFESPIGKVIFEEVRPIADAIRLAQRGGRYEVAVPLEALGLRPAPGAEILADVGVLRGREGRTMQRIYWSNANTTLISDLPSEARLSPADWGLWRFR
jgi:hypothetical protein